MKHAERVKLLFTSHYDELCSFIARKLGQSADAEEIAQDTFHNFLKLDDSAHIENPRAFLYKTANNLALNRIRKYGRHEAYVQTVHEDDNHTPTVEREVFAQRDIDLLEKQLNKLPTLTKDIFLMNRMDSMSYSEISKELNISDSSVQKHMMKALKFLRNVFEEE